MKGELIGSKILSKTDFSSGFSTIEVLIAMVILIFALTSVIQISFNNQSGPYQAKDTLEALNLASLNLKRAELAATEDFGALASEGLPSDGFYSPRIEAEETEEFTKKISSIVTWPGISNTDREVRLVSLVTDWRSLLSERCQNISNSSFAGLLPVTLTNCSKRT